MENKVEAPVFDLEKIKTMSDEQLDDYGKTYTQAVAAYVKTTLAQDLAPVIEELEKKEHEQQYRSALIELKENGDYYDFTEKQEQAEALAQTMPGLSEWDAKSALTAAYLLIKGAEAIAAHKAPQSESAQQLVDRVYENPEALKLLYERRAKEAAGEELPVFARSAGIAANVKKKPQTLADAREQASKAFKI